MRSDKRNSLMAIATGLISSLFNVTSSGDVPFCQPQQLQRLHHGSTKAHLCPPFLSPLPLRWRFVVRELWLQCETWVSAVLAEVLLTLFFAGIVTQSVQRAGNETKHSIHLAEQHTHFYIHKWGMHFNDWACSNFCIGWIDCRDAFHAVLCLYHYVMGWKWVNMKCTGYGFFIKL